MTGSDPGDDHRAVEHLDLAGDEQGENPATADSGRAAAGERPATGRQAAWNYLVFVLSKSSTLLMTVVVARMLEPSEFGIFALALLVANLFDYVKDLGVGAALVQSRRDWKLIAPTGLTMSVLFGLFAGGVLAATADLSARALGHPELTGFIRVLAIGLAISALSTIPAAWLRRSMNFSARLVPEASGALTKTVLTIGLAATGHGVWSLVYGQLAATVVTTVLYWWVGRTYSWPAFDGAVARELVRFGIPVTAVTLLTYAIHNVDYLAVGTRLGATDLGLYTLAYRLPELIVLNLCIVVSDVLFSALSSLQDDRASLTRHYLDTLTVVAAMTAPIGILLAVTARPLVDIMYGANYAASAPILSVLAIYVVLYAASFHAGDVFKAIGRPGVLTAINAAKLAILIGPVWWAAGHSVVLVAWALVGTEVVHLLIRMTVLQRMMGIRWSAIAGALLRPIAAAVPMGLVLLGLTWVTRGLATPLELGLLIGVGVGVYVGLLRFTAPQVFQAALGMVRGRLSRTASSAPTSAKEGS